MTAEPQESQDSTDVEEPTHPYTRKEIERLRRAANPPSSNPDEEWCEVAGRWMNISVDALAHIGLSGTPPGMITCIESCCVSGEIGVLARAPTLRTEVGPPIDDSPVEFVHPGRRRALWFLLGALVLTLVFVLRPPGSQSEPPTVGAASDPSEVEAPTPDAIVEPVPPPAPPPSLEPVPDPSDSTKPRNEAATPSCAAHRRKADAAQREGDWARLESLAKRTKCWFKSSDPKALLMRALFELERYEECIELGKNDRSKDIDKWHNNCTRALQ